MKIVISAACGLAILTAAIAPLSAAHAQSQARAPDTPSPTQGRAPVPAELETGAEALEEIVVIADFRAQPLMERAGSTTVIGADAIEALAALHVESVLSAAPNVSFSSGASRARFVQVRGVGDLEQFVDPKLYPSVGIAVDDIDLGGTMNAAMLFDTAQVEVLRGPQGTRFGTSALAGLVNVRSRAPTREREGYVTAGVADYSSRTLEAALSGPLGDKVSARLALQRHRGDGYMRNTYLGRDDTNGFDETSLRASLRFEPGDRARASFTALAFDGDNGYDAFSLDNTRETLSDEPGHDRQSSRAFSARGEWELGESSSVEAVMTRLESDIEYGFDEDWTYVGICDGTLCDPVLDFYSNTDNYTRDRTESTLDVRWLGRSSGVRSREYVVGVYGQDRDETLDREYYGSFTSRYASNRHAIYAQIVAGLADRLTLTAGYRFERFDDAYDDSVGGASATDDELVSGELGLTLDLDARTSLYATLARGDKAGGVNTEASSSLPFAQPEFQAFLAPRLRIAKETLLNREIGLHGRYRGDRLHLRLALFDMRRDDAQVESWVWDGTSFLWIGLLDNVAGSNRGAEAELDWALGRDWTLSASAARLSTEIDEILTFDLDLDDFVVRRGIEQARAPSWQYHVGARFARGPWAASLEIAGSDSSRFGYYHDSRLDGYRTVAASLARTFGAATVRLWGRNLTDEDVEVHGLYFGNDPRKGWVNERYRQLGEPRLVGLSVEYAF